MPPPTPGHAQLQHLLAEREWLRELARSLLGDGPDADDLAQETLTRALERGPRGSLTPAGARAWLATVARRLVGETWRSAQRRRVREAAHARNEAQASTAEVLERAALQRTIAEEVMALPASVRMAVLLRYFEGLEYDALAARQGITRAAARKRVSRGLARLRERLDQRQGGREAWGAMLVPLARPAASATSLAKGVWIVQAKTKWVPALAAVMIGAVGWETLRGLGSRSGAKSLTVTELLLVEREDSPVSEAADGAQRVVVQAGAEAEGAPRSQQSRPAFPSAPPGTTGVLDLRVTWASDGSPAAAIHGIVMPWGANDSFLMQREFVTDASGRCVVEQLTPGMVAFYFDRGGGGQAEIRPGQVALQEMRLDDGINVTGRVLDSEGRPVPGATLELSAHGNTNKGQAVTSADVTGRFRVRAITGQHAISARAPGHAPSAQIYVRATAGSTIELDLALRGAGGAIAGMVVDPEGAPLSGARVRIEPPGPSTHEMHTGRWVVSGSQPATCPTEKDGRFLAVGLEPGEHRVSVRAQELPPLEAKVVVIAGETRELSLRFEHGGGLAGMIRTEEGGPALGATVYVGEFGAFHAHQADAGLDGRYSIPAMTPGRHEVRASSPELGQASGVVEVTAGETATWDATLVASDSRVAGRVVDENGEPLVRWWVVVGRKSGGATGRVLTDENGRFEMSNLSPSATRLAVGPPDVFEVGLALRWPGRLPVDEELLLTVPDDARPSASLTAVLCGLDVAITPEAMLRLSSRAPSRWREAHPDARGLVHFKRVLPGTYDLRVEAPGAAPIQAAVTVAPGEELDLGRLLLTSGGRVRVTARTRQQDGGGDSAFAELLSENGQRHLTLAVDGSPALSNALAPGLYRLRVRGRWRTRVDVPFVVELGETAEIEVELEPAIERAIELRVGEGEELPNWVTLRVQDALGELYDETTLTCSTNSDSPWTVFASGIVPGAWTVSVTAEDGRAGKVKIDVTSLEQTSEAPTVLELH